MVTSLAVSRDLRLPGLLLGRRHDHVLESSPNASGARKRWAAGVRFAVRGGQLVATSLDPAGPLFRRGLHNGNVVAAIRWLGRGEAGREDRAAAILDAFAVCPGPRKSHSSAAQGAAPPPFQLLPAWQPLATLFVSAGGEWAFWTPEGYYNASMNGYRLFGWQVNRGLHELPVSTAPTSSTSGWRPDVIEQLLPAGSLPEAFRRAAAAPPERASSRRCPSKSPPPPGHHRFARRRQRGAAGTRPSSRPASWSPRAEN